MNPTVQMVLELLERQQSILKSLEILTGQIAEALKGEFNESV